MASIKNYSKVVLEVETKHKYIKFEGKWTIVVDKSKNEIVFSQVEITSDEVSARNRIDYQPDWSFKNDDEAKEIFSKIFKYIDIDGEKETKSKKVKELNNFIFKRNLKPSTLITFLGKTNASGALSTARSGTIVIKPDNFINGEFGIEEIENVEGWYFVSLINQIHSKSNIGFSKEEIDKIKEIKFRELFNFGFKNYPWGSKEDKNFEVDFRDAFISQNAINFIDKSNINELLLVPNEYIPETLLSYVKNAKYDREFVKNKLRRLWSRNVNINKESIFKKKTEKDFINGMNKFHRAHILEESKVLDAIIKNNDDKESLKLLRNLVHEENYILLDGTTHTYWDSNEITISEKNGKIIKEKCDDHDFKVLTKYNDKFLSEKFLTKKRSELIRQRNEWNKY